MKNPLVATKAILRRCVLVAMKFRTSSRSLLWEVVGAQEFGSAADGLHLISDDSDWGYQIRSNPFTVPKEFKICIHAIGQLETGGLAIGLLDVANQSWIQTKILHKGPIEETLVLDAQGIRNVALVFTNVQKGSSLLSLDTFKVETIYHKIADMYEVKGGAIEIELLRLIEKASPVPLDISEVPSEERPFCGAGAYLRTDYWVNIQSGGSYGHTCYVAEQLSRCTDEFVCFMSHEFDLLQEMGVKQVKLPLPAETSNEIDVMRAPLVHYGHLKRELDELRPKYIYERHVLGNYTGVKLSQDLDLPLILEFNGSEISMKRSFDDKGYEYEDVFSLTEDASFSQATLIVVVSEVIRDQLVAKGIDPERILINPNGCDPEEYKPISASAKNRIRDEFGWEDSVCVAGFIGTFGGWHGIDILAEALPELCRRNKDLRLLFIGDGNFLHLITDVVEKENLQSQVITTGSVPQSEGARLLKCCDIYLSPHNRHMVDSRFFGSPTKIFEYMSLSGAIVASDLEQIGEVLSPGLDAENLVAVEIDKERAVLCAPGDVTEFVNAITFLVKNPEIREKLGQNARSALIEKYSWEQHVQNIWQKLVELKPIVSVAKNE